MKYKRLGGMFFMALLILNLLPACAAAKKNATKESPNIILILTDDMDAKLLPYMENTNRLIAQEGATLTNYFVTSSLCCPSRASMLRGQYPHNTDILENFPGFRGFFKQGMEADTLAVWLNNAGYKTSLIGKYLNLYPIDAGRDYVPPGWTDWHVFLYKKGNADFYYNYDMNENGHFVQYGKSDADYSADVITQRAVSFINDSVKSEAPFFLLASVYAPHGPSTPAPRHRTLFADLTYPEAPSINEDVSDKPKIIYDVTSGVTGEEVDEGDANTIYIRRARSMQAVDEMVAELIQTLEQNGELDNTYIIFTSDNGFHIGEHNLPIGKGMAYEEDIHVPFLVRGPGISANSQVTQIAANIDIAPTVADMAGVKSSAIVDGRSLLPLLKNETVSKWRNTLLVEMGYIETASSMGVQSIALKKTEDEKLIAEYPDGRYDNYLSETSGGAFRSIRMEQSIYIEYANGEAEYYDLLNDPYQLTNTAAVLAPDMRTRFHAWLEELKTCAAESCRTAEEKNVK